MTLFGWFLAAAFVAAAVNSEKAGRIFSIFCLLGILLWGTGNGL